MWQHMYLTEEEAESLGYEGELGGEPDDNLLSLKEAKLGMVVWKVLSCDFCCFNWNWSWLMMVNVFLLTRSVKQSSMSTHPLNSTKLGCPPSKSSMSMLIICHLHSLKSIQSLMSTFFVYSLLFMLSTKLSVYLDHMHALNMQPLQLNIHCVFSTLFHIEHQAFDVIMHTL